MDSGLPLSGWRRRSKSPHCRVSSSAVRLDVQGQKLPWSTSKMIPIPTRCKSVVRSVLRVPACSKGVIGIFSLFITSIAIVLMFVSKQPRRGVVHWLIKGIAKVRRESGSGPIKPSDTANESKQKRLPQCPNHLKNQAATFRARAITKNNPRKNLVAKGLVATSGLIPILALPTKNTVALSVTRPCDVFSFVKRSGVNVLNTERKNLSQNLPATPTRSDQHR